MPHSHSHSVRSLGQAARLSAILHGSNAASFEDGIFLPSSCYSRTWLLDNFEETCSETPTCQPTGCEQRQRTGDSCVQWSCLPTIVQTTSSNSKSCEKTAVLECTSQHCQSRNSQHTGFVTQSYQTSRTTRCYPLKTTVSESCRTVEFESSQCCSQVPESSSCSPLDNAVSGSQFLETSNTHEPACCVTGGF